MKKYTILLLIFVLLFTVSCTQSSPQKKEMSYQNRESSIFEQGTIEKIKITSSEAPVRSGFSENSPVIATLNKNQKLDVIGKIGNWYAVNLPNSYLGAISVEDATPIVVEERNFLDQPDSPSVPETREPNEQAELDNELTPEIPTREEAREEVQPEVEEQPRVNEEPAADNLSSMESQMLRLINQAREKNSVPPLKVDLKVTRVARIKSQDMIDNDYFSHYSPTYGSPFDMLDHFGVKYVYAGENIAGNSTVERAHEALMDSSGHRKNILNPDFTHVGIGIKKGSPYGYIFTQMFISKPK